MFVLIADYQVLTDREKTSGLSETVLELLLDYLAVGIDPERSSIFCHSYVQSLNQLILPFMSMVSVGELERNPTVKDEIRMADQPTVSSLMFTYPVHQAADILAVKGNLVPAGKDQLPHLELTRDIARRFNLRYAGGQTYFPVAEALLSEAPLLLGVDGQKMGKSLGNAIAIGASEDETAALIRRAKTDSERTITYDPDARPEVSNLVMLGALCAGSTPESFAEEIVAAGSRALKERVTEAVNEYFRPIRERRRTFTQDESWVWKVLHDGNERARGEADQTLDDVMSMMGMRYPI